MKQTLIDAGFYVGQYTDKFLTEHLDFDCYAFEPNPRVPPNLPTMRQEIRAKWGDMIRFSDQAVWISDCEVVLHQGCGDKQGSSILYGKGAVHYGGIPQIVKAFDFADWMAKTFTVMYDFVHLKMDIEGAEYPVLFAMIDNRSIELVNELHLETHSHKFRDGRYNKEHEILINQLGKLFKPENLTIT